MMNLRVLCCFFAIEIKSRSIVNKKNLKNAMCLYRRLVRMCGYARRMPKDEQQKKKPRKAKLLLQFFLISISGFGHVNDESPVLI